MRHFRTIDEAVEALYALNVGVVGRGGDRHERPHKPVLLLAVLDLIASVGAVADRIPWSPALRERFSRYFAVVRRQNDEENPELPFYHLRTDRFWEPLELVDGNVRSLPGPPSAGDARAGRVFARIIGGMESFFRMAEDRMRIREALVSRYFPNERETLARMFMEPSITTIQAEPVARASEDIAEYSAPGRSPAFRRKVLEVYDYQCAACGLRIKLPDADLTFVDGAHIIPFQESRNDHPTNGMALCKNHHWAMDRFLLVPMPDRVWKVSPRLDSRRSRGEEALMELNGKPLLPPHDDAFLPDPAALAWRAERIYA